MPKVRKAIKHYQNKSYERRKEDEEIKKQKRKSAIITPGEKSLSKALEKEGVKHYKQVNVGHYVADLIIVQNGKTYAVEVEGRSHGPKGKYDRRRVDEFEKRGIEVIRLSERDARTNPKETAKTIKNTIHYLEQKRKQIKK